MAVTNKQIIMTEMIAHNITEPVDTYAGWQRRGMQVQKGSKAVFTTSIWKPCKPRVNKDGEEIQPKKSMIMVKAAFFGLSQVESARV